MNKNIKSLIAVGIMAISMTSCSTGTLLSGKTYDITELNGSALPGSEETKAFISFKDGEINTSVGCNSIFAPYKALKDGTILISEGGSTRMLCPDELREDEYLATLQKVKRYEVSGKTISFYDGNNKLLFKAIEK